MSSPLRRVLALALAASAACGGGGSASAPSDPEPFLLVPIRPGVPDDTVLAAYEFPLEIVVLGTYERAELLLDGQVVLTEVPTGIFRVSVQSFPPGTFSLELRALARGAWHASVPVTVIVERTQPWVVEWIPPRGVGPFPPDGVVRARVSEPVDRAWDVSASAWCYSCNHMTGPTRTAVSEDGLELTFTLDPATRTWSDLQLTAFFRDLAGNGVAMESDGWSWAPADGATP